MKQSMGESDPAYDVVERIDLAEAEQRISDLESEVRTLKAEVTSLRNWRLEHTR